MKNLIIKPNTFPAKQLLVLLLLTDILFLLLHLLQVFTPFISSGMFNVETDRGYAEFFQYIKYFWAALIFAYLGLSNGKVYWSWAVLFSYLLIDDSLEVHERMGEFLANKLSFSEGFLLRSVDYGEVLYALLVATTLFLAIALAYQQGNSAFRQFSRKMFKLFAIMAFFAVGVDMLHIMASHHLPESLFHLIGTVEDGGEMMVMSFIFCYSFSHLSMLESKSKAVVRSEMMNRMEA